MGTSLNGLTPAGTYPGLIKTGDNAPIDGTLKTLSDGNGNNLPMSVSTTTINLTGTAQVGGVAIANTTQLAAKQDTLVSGTNIKTINGTSVLGSGNIVTPTTNPSGVAGAIQFSNGSAFASDATNLFWDDTNNRLGVGTNTPSKSLHIRTQHGVANGILLNSQNACGITITGDDYPNELIISKSNNQFEIATNGFFVIRSTVGLTINNPTIKGSGSTAATNSLLVQNGDGTNLLRVRDDGNVFCEGGGAISSVGIIGTVYGLFGGASYEPSASLVCGGTTQGFLPPRMTATQKNAISSPASGLVVYDSTTNKLQCYNGSTWNDLF